MGGSDTVVGFTDDSCIDRPQKTMVGPTSAGWSLFLHSNAVCSCTPMESLTALQWGLFVHSIHKCAKRPNVVTRIPQGRYAEIYLQKKQSVLSCRASNPQRG